MEGDAAAGQKGSHHFQIGLRGFGADGDGDAALGHVPFRQACFKKRKAGGGTGGRGEADGNRILAEQGAERCGSSRDKLFSLVHDADMVA